MRSTTTFWIVDSSIAKSEIKCKYGKHLQTLPTWNIINWDYIYFAAKTFHYNSVKPESSVISAEIDVVANLLDARLTLLFGFSQCVHYFVCGIAGAECISYDIVNAIFRMK